MIQQKKRVPLTSWLVVAALCLLMAGPATLATAAPTDALSSGTLLGWATDWWNEVKDGWMALTAGSEAAPAADPNGFSIAPLPEGDLSTNQTPEGDGEAAPNADPDG